MTATSDLIEKLLVPDWGDTLKLNSRGMQYVTSAIRNDPQLDDTIVALYTSGALARLFKRLIDPESSRMLLASIACRVMSTHHLVTQAMTIAIATSLDASIQLAVQSGPWAYIPPVIYYGICANLAAASRSMGFTTGAGTAKPSSATQGPFSGVGATGVNPTTLSIPIADQITLFCTKKKVSPICHDDQKLAEYTNPLAAPGTLGAYLNSLSPQQKIEQANILIGQPISSLFPYVYPAAPPARSRVIAAAAEKHRLTPQLVAAIILAEAHDQSRNEDAAEFRASIIVKYDGSIGLGQVLVSTARKYDLFADLLDPSLRNNLSHQAIATLLASDEINIFATARYIRIVADAGARKSLSQLPNTQAQFPGINLAAYTGHASTWPRDNVRALGMYYTSLAWNDVLKSPGWGYFVGESHNTLLNPGISFP